ncbi:MAG: hypothetical protein HRU13_00105, partial [Phycisphaerales bacterium]|nr:hypothetical protein [Phycisphaerales bacterium]
MSFSSGLTDTCTVRVATQATDSTTGYGRSVSYADTTDVPCLIQQTSTAEAIEFGKLTGRGVYRAFFEFGAGPQGTSDRVVWR